MKAKRLSVLPPLLLLACGGAPAATDGTGPGTGSGAVAAAGDVSFDLGARPLSGRYYTAAALGRPALPQVEPKKKLSLDKHRKELEAARAPVKGKVDLVTLEVKGQVVATRVYVESKTTEDPTAQAALLREAHAVLRELRAAGAAGVDTLRMLGFHEFTQGDFAAAADVFAELVAKHGSHADALEFRTYHARALALLGKHAEALAALDGVALDAKGAGEAAYVLAWSRWATGDGAGAWAAIRAAAAGWPTAGTRPAVADDLMLIAAHVGAPEADAAAALEALPGAMPDARFATLYKLSNAYGSAGRFAQASVLVDRAIAAVLPTAPPENVPKLRLRQAEYAMRLGTPQEAAAHLGAALGGCATCAPEAKAELVAGAVGIANMLHTVFATALDERYYAPTKAIYLAIAQHGDAERKAAAEKFTVQLDQSKTNSRAGTGKHDESAVKALLQMREQDVVACYEATLLVAPTLSGTLGLALEFRADGTVAGATTTPPGGAEGLAAVGACVEQRARAWTLPARSMPGTTRVAASYPLTVKE